MEKANKRKEAYWDTNVEMSARAFEVYVIDKLKEQGGKSDYLANIKTQEEWGHKESYPYPLAEEMTAIKPAFDKLFEVIETRTHDDGRVEMYSIKGEDGKEIGAFGVILEDYRGDAEGAITALMKLKEGEARAVLHHKDVGDIDLVWGEEGTGKSDGDGYGLAKLVKYHPEVVENLQNILDDMKVVMRSDNRIRLESDKYKAVVRLEYNNEAKNWLLTAYEKRGATDTTTDTAGFRETGDTARRSSTSDSIVAQKIADFYNKDDKAKGKHTITTLKTELQSGDLGKYMSKLIEGGRVRLVSKADNSPDGVQGWTSDNGTITLVADQIRQGEAQAVLLHEMFHSGVKPLMEEQVWQKMMRQLDSLYRQFEDPNNKGANQFFKQAHARVALARDRQGSMSDTLAVEEFAAYAVEEYERAPKAVKSWVFNLLDQLRAWILRQFGKQFGQITPAAKKKLKCPQ